MKKDREIVYGVTIGGGYDAPCCVGVFKTLKDAQARMKSEFEWCTGDLDEAEEYEIGDMLCIYKTDAVEDTVYVAIDEREIE